MNVLILGAGRLGLVLAGRLRDAGHLVSGTTTTPEKVSALGSALDAVHVLNGSESGKVAAAARGCDAIVVTVAPRWKASLTPEARQRQYKAVLVDSCASAVAACSRVLFCSSFSVYGDGGAGDTPVDENTPVTASDDPSPRNYQAAEQVVLAVEGGCVLRFPDMYGSPGDLSYPERIKASHAHFGGKTVFSPLARLYAMHVDDVVNAIRHALEHGLSGIFNVCDDERVPYTNKQVFDAICAREGLEPLVFLGQVKAPERKISARKLYGTGYRVTRRDPNAAIVEEYLG